MNRTKRTILFGVAVALGVSLDVSPASSQTTFWACRVPTVGAIYMIADAAANCLDAAHVKFSWAEGAAPADGSITTAKLADAAVTTAKIAADAVGAAAIAPDAVGSSEVLDNSLTASDIAANAVGSSELANGSVTAAKLAAGSVLGVKSEVFNLVTLSAGLQNIESIVFTAPASGSAVLMASGYCNISPSTGALQYAVGFGLAANEAPSQALGGTFVLNPNAGATLNQLPYATSRTVNVSAGANTFFLNLNFYTGASGSCAGHMTAIYAPAQLP